VFLDTSVLLAADVPALHGDTAIGAASLAELHFVVMVTIDAATRGTIATVVDAGANLRPPACGR
jgi:hypothetical protein